MKRKLHAPFLLKLLLTNKIIRGIILIYSHEYISIILYAVSKI